jgi:hypothetical protein
MTTGRTRTNPFVPISACRSDNNRPAGRSSFYLQSDSGSACNRLKKLRHNITKIQSDSGIVPVHRLKKLRHNITKIQSDSGIVHVHRVLNRRSILDKLNLNALSISWMRSRCLRSLWPHPGSHPLFPLFPLFPLSLSLSLFSLFLLPVTAQPLSINASNQPLNEVVYSLITENNIQCSYNDRLLSRHNVTVNASFPSFDRALDQLLSRTATHLPQEGDIYLIIKKSLSPTPSPALSPTATAARHSPSPTSYHNQGGSSLVPTDGSALSRPTPPRTPTISYLGYYILDTLLQSGTSYITLAPSAIGLSEVVIEGKTVAYSMETGDAPGQVRLNQVTARKLPGNGDNAVFNFLRLQPGILAAGEQSSDLIIWGSYEGHSKVMFDGFTLYGMKNFNDNISAVNPTWPRISWCSRADTVRSMATVWAGS